MAESTSRAPKTSSRRQSSPGAYAVQSVLRACDLLRAFRSDHEVLHLKDFVARTHLKKTTVFRLLRSLEQAGAVRKVGTDRYRAHFRLVPEHRFRLGCAGQTSESSFSRDVLSGVRQAAEREGIDLIEMDNRYSPTVALRNAEQLIKDGVHAAIEFQSYEEVAPVISSRFLEAKIPLIAVDVPHPGATYFGGNNYQAGRLGGHGLGRWARRNWPEGADEIILLDMSMAGSLVQSRLMGLEEGLAEVFPALRHTARVHLEGEGRFGPGLEAVRQRLRHSPAKRFLIGAVNDLSALGALRAFEEAGRAEDCAAAGQGAFIEARRELRNPATRLAGSVAYFPERYGEGLIRLTLDILSGKPVPPAVFVKHVLLTRANVDRYYPNDMLLENREIHP